MLDYEQLYRQFIAEQERNPFRFLHENIFHILMRNIASFVIQPGERIHEKNIANVLNVSRSPVRQALNQIVASGFAEYTKGVGCQVIPFTKANLSDLLVIRKAIEPTIAYLATERATKSDIAHLRAILDKMKTLETDVSTVDIDSYCTLESEFHSVLSDISGNPYIQQTYRSLEYPIMRSLYMMRYHPLKKRINKIPGKAIDSVYSVHLPIFLAIQLKEPTMAYNAMMTHLEHLRYDFSIQR